VNFILYNAALSIFVLLAILACVSIGRRIGTRRMTRFPGEKRDGLGVIEGVVYALLGLVIAFSFNGAGERVLARRAQIGNEVNVIGTAYLRIDVLPKESQPEIRELFRHYLDLRRRAVQALPDLSRAETLFAEAGEVQMQIWDRAIAATRGGTATHASMLFLPALNAMIDEQTTARIATLQHPPLVIEALLVALILLAALFIGEATTEMKRLSRLHILGLALLLSVMTFVIRDLERPMVGLIKIEDTRGLVEDLAKMMAE
jgi:hypothetical protein